MSKGGWKRLEEDYLNPELKHSWVRKGDIYRQWGFFVENGLDVHLWMDDWEDVSNNIVRYGLKYKTKRRNNVSITKNDSVMEVVVVYIPNKLRPSSEAIHEQMKEAEIQMRDNIKAKKKEEEKKRGRYW